MFPGDCGEIEEARIEGVSESADVLEGGRGGGCMVPPLTTMFLQAIDVPDTDLLHHDVASS